MLIECLMGIEFTFFTVLTFVTQLHMSYSKHIGKSLESNK